MKNIMFVFLRLVVCFLEPTTVDENVRTLQFKKVMFWVEANAIARGTKALVEKSQKEEDKITKRMTFV